MRASDIPGIQARLAAGIRVADLGCGRGRALRDLAARYPARSFVGFDLSQEAIDRAHALHEGVAGAGRRGVGAMRGRERALAMLREAGFTDVTVHRLEHDIVNDYDIARV